MNISLLLLPLALGASQQKPVITESSGKFEFPGQFGLKMGGDYPRQDFFLYEKSSEVTAISVVQCLPSDVAPSTKPNSFPKQNSSPPAASFGFRPSRPQLWTERVEVVDSDTLKKGAKMTVVVRNAVPPKYRMTPGHRYLVLAQLPENGRFDFNAYGASSNNTLEAQPDQIAGLAAFETHARTIDHAGVLTDRIANSIVDCIPGSTEPELRRITDWLGVMGYPDGGRQNNPLGRESFPLADTIRNDADGASAYKRMRLFQVLCLWHVLGSEQPLVNAMIELANRPDAPGRGDVFTSEELAFSKRRSVVTPGYAGVTLDGNRWADIIASAKNKVVKRYLLMHVHRAPDAEHNRKLAQVLLADENDALLNASIVHFSAVLKRPELHPEYQNVNGNSVWVNKDTALAALRSYYKVKAAPSTKQ